MSKNTTIKRDPEAKAFEETEKALRDDEQRLGDGAAAQQSLEVELTVFVKTGGILSKKIWLGSDDKPQSDGSACKMWKGTAHRTKLGSPAELVDLIDGLQSNEALTLGRLRPGIPDNVGVVKEKELENTTAVDPIARVTDYSIFAEGQPAFVLLDHDSKGLPPEIAIKMKEAGGFWSVVTSVVPGFQDAARVSRASTSSGLYHKQSGENFPGSKSQHDYVLVKDGSDIERALKTLHERLWLEGYGYKVVSSAGQILDRSLVDASVYGPERLVFEGPPFCVPPIGQDRKARRPKFVDGIAIDTKKVIADLTKAEKKRLREMKAEAEQKIRPQAEKVRRAWAQQFAKKHGLSQDQAERIAKAAADRHTLAPEIELVFDDLGQCTVADVLGDPGRYVGETLADPLEPEKGPCKAKVLRRTDEEIFINSFVHGGIVYQLGEDGGISLDDFHAHLPSHRYIFEATREMWPASSINSRFGEGASVYLDRNRAVEQITWAPGLDMLIKNWLIAEGGWIERKGVATFNLYRPSMIISGDANQARPWTDHIDKIYPNDADHIILYLAQLVQYPGEKINHALVLAGKQGIGKDTILEPVKYAVGPWNFAEVSPQQLLGNFNSFLKTVILRVSEARDQGDVDRYKLYEHLKTFTAAPPDVLRVNEKHLREYYVVNCCGVVITTNFRTDGIYLPADDRRHYVAWSDYDKEDFDKDYWQDIWGWYYGEGGIEHVTAYLRELDISGFDPKAPPLKTQAWWDIVDASRAPEDAEFADALDKLKNPEAVTLAQIAEVAADDFREWLKERKNRRAIPHRLEACGYVQVSNSDAKDRLWKVGDRREVIYARNDLTLAERRQAAVRIVEGW